MKRHKKGINLAKTPIISIVDDNETFRRATARLMRSLGHAVAAFASAEEFLNSGRLNDTACLICDVQMPGMSGIELQEKLLTQGHRLPIIFVTAYPQSNVREQALTSGALGFLDKPFEEETLLSCLGQALSAPNA
jgi:FixJ family two-component response regulator